MQLLTQWYLFQTASVKYQISDDEEEKRSCRLAMMKANDVMLIANAERYSWDYVPMALETAADLECLVRVLQCGSPETLESFSAPPFVALINEAKFEQRLTDPAKFGLTQHKDANVQDACDNEASKNDRLEELKLSREFGNRKKEVEFWCLVLEREP